MAKMALAMRAALERINRESGYALQVRIGLHTGAVVAGVIGKRKFIYDMWGDTVNTASRMESSGVPGEIQITRDLNELLKNEFDTKARGTIKVKGKGDMETFLLLGSRQGDAPATELRFAARNALKRRLGALACRVLLRARARRFVVRPRVRVCRGVRVTAKRWAVRVAHVLRSHGEERADAAGRSRLRDR